jgi:hypothetical protein
MYLFLERFPNGRRCPPIYPDGTAHFQLRQSPYLQELFSPVISSTSIQMNTTKFEFKSRAEDEERAVVNEADEPLLGQVNSSKHWTSSWPLYIHVALIALYTSLFIFLTLVSRSGPVAPCVGPTFTTSNHARKPCKVQRLKT